jgi:uncharacterized damage-inducible protein DinB
LEETLNQEVIFQFAHVWRTFEAVVNEFDSDRWLLTGRGLITPARLSFHMLQSIRYYIEDSTITRFTSGLSFNQNWETAENETLPSQNDITTCAGEFKSLTDDWLRKMDLTSDNATFPWAGKTKLGLVLFTMRHFTYHMGELSMLLNESCHGNANDNFKDTVEGK